MIDIYVDEIIIRISFKLFQQRQMEGETDEVKNGHMLIIDAV